MALGDSIKRAGAIKPSSIEKDIFEEAMFANRSITMLSNQQLRIDWDGSNNPIYVGQAPRGLGSDEDGWAIQKITWTGSNPTLIQVGFGAWDNRTTTVTYS